MVQIDQTHTEALGGTHTIGSYGQADSYYRILDVDPGASRVEIREAYLRLKSTFNSGSDALYSLVSEEEAKEQMALVEEAFRILSDDVARREYDLRHGFARQGARPLGSSLTDFDPIAAGEEMLHTERLLYAREQQGAASDAGPWNEGPSAEETPMVRTTRSTMPIIKLKAHRAGSEEMREAMQALIERADPGDGDLFRRLRELVGVSEEEMQERIKVSLGYLQAIETNRFERLPQAVYVKGFLRSYFRYLCAPDAEKMVAAFSARLTDWQAHRKA